MFFSRIVRFDLKGGMKLQRIKHQFKRANDGRYTMLLICIGWSQHCERF